MNTLTNITQRQLDNFREDAAAYHHRYVDWNSLWILEDKVIPAHAVSVSHPTIQFGLDYDLYSHTRITAAELYGILRSHVIEEVALSQTNPVYGCVGIWHTPPNIEDVYSEDWYFVIDYSELYFFLNRFLKDTLEPKKEKVDWKKEGF